MEDINVDNVPRDGDEVPLTTRIEQLELLLKTLYANALEALSRIANLKLEGVRSGVSGDYEPLLPPN